MSLLIAFLLVFCASAEADIYKYVDEEGIVHFTNAPVGKNNQKILKEKPKKEISDFQYEKGANVQKTKISYTAYTDIVEKKAKEHSVDPSLVNAVIKTESNWNKHAISKKGAVGLMQLMPSTADMLKVKNVFDAEANIDGGTRYLKYLIERFNGNLTLALAAYNAGPNKVEQYGDVPPISETRNYVKKVLGLYNGYPYSYYNDVEKGRKEPIYKILSSDGTILFTNCSSK
jgi:soluble lytic murein transglycosylase-like protein